MMSDMYPAMGLWMALWGLISVAMLILIVLAIIWLVRAMTRPNARTAEHQDHAEEVSNDQNLWMAFGEVT